MSRILLRRVVVVVAAYAVALQPIVAAGIARATHDSQVFCSGSSDHSPPIGHRSDAVCCLSACCTDLAAIVPVRMAVVLTEARPEAAVSEPAALSPAPERYPRSRSPPASALHQT